MLDRPARTRLPQDARREQLIDAAIGAIAEHGLANVTLSKVASLAGLTASMVNFHFDSKQELLHATLQRLAEEYRSACEAGLAAAGPDPAAGLMALVEASFARSIAEPAKLAVWYAFWGEGRSRADYMAICGASEHAVYEAVRGLVAELRTREGASIDVRAAALGLCGLIDCLSQEALIQDEGFDHADAILTCRRYLSNLFPAAFPVEAEPPAAPAVLVDDDDGEPLPLTLPAWTYRDEGFSARERETIHMPAWQLSLIHI